MLRLVALLCFLVASTAAAQSEYDGVRFGPTVHGAYSGPNLRGGFGVDLSVTRWFDVELWSSLVSHPNGGSNWYSRAWSTGIAASSRVTWGQHAFVYGAGFVYTSTFHCPQGCALLAAIALEEERTAFNMRALQGRLGYEVRWQGAWLFRALATFDVPYKTRRVIHLSPDDTYPYHEPASTFMHASLVLTLGYTFRVR